MQKRKPKRKPHSWDAPKGKDGERIGPTKMLTLRLSDQALKLIHKAATKQSVSANVFCLNAIKKAVDKELTQEEQQLVSKRFSVLFTCEPKEPSRTIVGKIEQDS